MEYDCIIPASGLSSRMGRWKLTLEIDGKSIIRRAVENALVHTGQVIVVGGFRREELKRHLAHFDDIVFVENGLYDRGMITSIKAALPHVKTDRFFVSLADMPFIPPQIYLHMSRRDFQDALFPTYEGRRGHPVLLDTRLRGEIMDAPDDLMMKDLLASKEISLMPVDDSAVLTDIDTPGDFLKYGIE